MFVRYNRRRTLRRREDSQVQVLSMPPGLFDPYRVCKPPRTGTLLYWNNRAFDRHLKISFNDVCFELAMNSASASSCIRLHDQSHTRDNTLLHLNLQNLPGGGSAQQLVSHRQLVPIVRTRSSPLYRECQPLPLRVGVFDYMASPTHKRYLIRDLLFQ